MITLPLWQQILIYACILTSLFIYVKTSQLTLFDRPLIPLKYRILLSVFFPAIIAMALVFSAFIIAFIIAIVFVVSLFALIQKIKIKN